MTQSPLRCCTSIIWSSTLVQASFSLDWYRFSTGGLRSLKFVGQSSFYSLPNFNTASLSDTLNVAHVHFIVCTQSKFSARARTRSNTHIHTCTYARTLHQALHQIAFVYSYVYAYDQVTLFMIHKRTLFMVRTRAWPRTLSSISTIFCRGLTQKNVLNRTIQVSAWRCNV